MSLALVCSTAQTRHHKSAENLDGGISWRLQTLLDVRAQVPICFRCLMTVCSNLLKTGLEDTWLVVVCGDGSCHAVYDCSQLQHRLQHHAASQLTPSPPQPSQTRCTNSQSLAMLGHQESVNVTVPDLFVVFQLALLCPMLLQFVLKGRRPQQ